LDVLQFFCEYPVVDVHLLLLEWQWHGLAAGGRSVWWFKESITKGFSRVDCLDLVKAGRAFPIYYCPGKNENL